MYQIQNIVFDIEDTERDLARWAMGFDLGLSSEVLFKIMYEYD